MASLVQPGLSAFLPVRPGRSRALPREGAGLPDQRAGVAIELDAAEKSFGDRRVLHRIDLRIEPGSFVAIVGRSGSGKSTLLRLLGGLDRPETGAVTLDGQPATAAAGAVRIMFQEGRLLPWRRVIDNVRLGLSAEHRARAGEALAAVGLADRAQDWPRVLSGGQKQRVALARALASQPRLILLDEPLGALDALTRLEMQALIERIWQRAGFTAVLVTHDVSEAAALADRILLIEDGQIAMDMDVDLPRPRGRTAAFADIEARVLAKILQVA